MKDTKKSYQRFLGIYNNKRIIPFLHIDLGDDDSRMRNIEIALTETVEGCNRVNGSVLVDYDFIQEADGSRTYTLIVDHNCRYSDELIKSYVVMNCFAYLGSAIRRMEFA